jgi:hypothetical protein
MILYSPFNETQYLETDPEWISNTFIFERLIDILQTRKPKDFGFVSDLDTRIKNLQNRYNFKQEKIKICYICDNYLLPDLQILILEYFEKD